MPRPTTSNMLLRRVARYSGALLAAAAVAVSAASTDQGPRLNGVTGSVLVETGDGSYNLYEPGTALATGDRIIVLRGASATLQADGCSVSLATNSIHQVDDQPCAPGEPMLLAAAPSGPMAASGDTAAAMGSLWNDANSDLVRGAGEGGVSGVRIALGNNRCQVGSTCPMATSDTADNFGFASLEPGTYQVYVENEDDDFVAIGSVILAAGTTTTIAIASTSTGLVLVESAALAATTTGTSAAAAAGGTGSAMAVGDWVGLGLTLGALGYAGYEIADDDNNDSPPLDITP